jgi:hypothetical protein
MNSTHIRPLAPFLLLDHIPLDAEVILWGGRKFVRLHTGGWAMVEGET